MKKIKEQKNWNPFINPWFWMAFIFGALFWAGVCWLVFG